MLTQQHQRQKLAFANTLRGIAALCVVVSHYLGVFWLSRDVVIQLIDATKLPDTVITPKIVHVINHFDWFNWGAFGVALFFLISGFVIPFSLMTYNRLSFMISRILRIWPTYIVGFSVSLFAILLASHIFHLPFPYKFKQVLVGYMPGLRDILFYPSIDGIVWTLEIEVKFYALCLLIAPLIKKGSMYTFLLPFGLFISSYLINTKTNYILTSHYIYTYSFVSQFIIFMFIGVLFNFYYRQSIGKTPFFLMLTAFYLMFVFLLKTGPSLTIIYEVPSCSAALLLFMVAYFIPSLFKGNRFFNKLADISYPLYVVHGISGYVFLRILLSYQLNTWVAMLITVVSIFIIALFIHQCIEKPSNELGKILATRANAMKFLPKFIHSLRQKLFVLLAQE